MLIMLFGVIAITPDALLVRLMRDEMDGARDADMQIIFWKYLFATVWNALFAMYHEGGCKPMLRKIPPGRWHIAVGVLLQASIAVCLMLAFLSTLAARALLFFALSPLWAAGLSWMFMGDRVPLRTVVTLLLALASVLVIFLPSVVLRGLDGPPPPPPPDQVEPTHDNATAADDSNFSDDDEDDNDMRATVQGDLLAVAAGAALGALITLSRSAKVRAPNAAMLACVWLGSILCLHVAAVWQAAAGRQPMGSVTLRFIGLAIADSLCSSSVYIATVVAPRYASSADVGLINLLETILGPLWVFIGLGEAIDVWTIAGGAMLILVLAAHELCGLAAAAREAREARGERSSRRTAEGLEAAAVDVLDIGDEAWQCSNES